jgi:GTP pyrophosphokinase
VRLIEHAYDIAAGQHSASCADGDPYITHPLAVATILAEWDDTRPSALPAHDHRGHAVFPGRLRASSATGRELVDGVTKLDKVKYGEAARAETVRKDGGRDVRDIRVLVIKLADRLQHAHAPLPAGRNRAEVARGARVFAPLAHRLGMNTVKWERGPGLRHVVPEALRRDRPAGLRARAPATCSCRSRRGRIGGPARCKDQASVTGKPKHYYSVYQKMIARNVGFDDITTWSASASSSTRCVLLRGAQHSPRPWNPVPGRFKDYRGAEVQHYQSLHTTVIGPEGKPVELQIRTWGMHRRAEYGVAAHWKYKEETMLGTRSSDLAWLRQLVDWQRETADPAEFLESLRFDLGAAEVYVFTPRGQVVALPQGATPVDFAYAIHTEVGHRTIRARVNGRLVALEAPSTTATRSRSSLQGAGP